MSDIPPSSNERLQEAESLIAMLSNDMDQHDFTRGYLPHWRPRLRAFLEGRPATYDPKDMPPRPVVETSGKSCDGPVASGEGREITLSDAHEAQQGKYRPDPSPAETSGWQPIETAPKGGKWVLLWWPRITDCAVVGYYSHKGCWCSPIGSWEGYLEGENFPGPTHWQPLPSPVKSTAPLTTDPGRIDAEQFREGS